MTIPSSPLTLTKGIEVHLTSAKSLRSRVRRKSQARFCRRVRGGDFSFDSSGLAIVQGNQVLWGAELTHRGQQIKNDLESRRAIRRNRRNRKTRYRKPRFLNRTREAWMVATQLRIQGKKHRDLGQPHPSICPNYRHISRVS